MKCTPIRIGDTVGIACTRNGRRKHCTVMNGWRRCHQWATLECDYHNPDRKSGTCDKALCRWCAVEVGPDKHHCPHHPKGQTEIEGL